jgi:hypothetical protein
MIRIYSVRQQRATIRLGSDDHVRLLLNGKQSCESVRERIAVPDADAVPTVLKAGWNILVARVVNVTGDDALYLRLEPAATR